MHVDILTLFPGMFDAALGHSILKRARDRGAITVDAIDFRQWGVGVHKKVDDTPYGGGPGMVIQCAPVVEAVRNTLEKGRAAGRESPHLILLTPRGRRLEQAVVRELAAKPWIVMLCGHYEGMDERIRLAFPWDEVSLGDFVLTGGEIAAMALVDATARLLPGVLGDATSANDESFESGLLEYPQYSRPPEFEGMTVPEILFSGHHAKIADWRRQQAEAVTQARRPDLWEKYLAARPEQPKKKQRRRKSDAQDNGDD